MSSSVLRRASGVGDAYLYLCFRRTHWPQGSDKFFRVKLPEPYPFADAPRQAAHFRQEGNSLVLSAGTSSDSVDSCDVPRRQELVKQLPILAAEPRGAMTPPENRGDAIIVSYGAWPASALTIFPRRRSSAIATSRSM
jgi:hypothetical protein